MNLVIVQKLMGSRAEGFSPFLNRDLSPPSVGLTNRGGFLFSIT